MKMMIKRKKMNKLKKMMMLMRISLMTMMLRRKSLRRKGKRYLRDEFLSIVPNSVYLLNIFRNDFKNLIEFFFISLYIYKLLLSN
jgi:hypothetical protein